jgi:hypothetical protein
MRKPRKAIVAFTILLVCCLPFRSAVAQLSNYEFDGEKAMRFALFYGSMTNQWSGKIEDEKFSTVVIDLSTARSTFGSFKYQASHRYKILGDIISVLYSGNGIAEKPDPGTPTLTSIFGWHNFAISPLHTSHFQLSAGGHIGDYFYGIEGLHSDRKSDKNTSGTIYYYGGYGPVLMADVALGSSELLFHYEGAYVFTFGNEPIEGLPDQKPNILNQTFELRFRRMFLNMEVVYGLNDWGNRIKRQQFGVGISI